MHETVEQALARGVKITYIPFGVSSLDEASGIPKSKVRDYKRGAKKGSKAGGQANKEKARQEKLACSILP